MMHREDLRRVAPGWIKYSEDVRADKLASFAFAFVCFKSDYRNVTCDAGTACCPWLATLACIVPACDLAQAAEPAAQACAARGSLAGT